MSQAESALSLSMKDSEMTLSFIADAYGRCLGLFVLILLAPALLTFIGGKLQGGLSPAPTPSTEATEASPFKRLTGYFSGKAPEPTTPKAPVEPCNCLVALRLGIFFVLYPAVISYLWFYYIPTRSIPK